MTAVARNRRTPTEPGPCLFVGIDEAGYGPKLGPLVVAAVAFRGPAALRRQDWWELLAPAFSRAPASDRFAVDDSKRLLARRRGFADLSRTVETLLHTHGCRTDDLGALLEAVGAGDEIPLRREHWFRHVEGEPEVQMGHRTVPQAGGPAGSPKPSLAGDEPTSPLVGAASVDRFRDALHAASLELARPRARVIFPRPFNGRVHELGNKAELMVELVSGLVREYLRDRFRVGPPPEAIVITVDHLGGRRYYRAMLEPAAGAAFLQTVEESRTRSVYRVLQENCEVEISFRVEADSAWLPVALASMLAKYLRERCMAGFNSFWTFHVPGLAPTAGYPQDARRFLRQIRPHLARLAIPLESVWRSR